MSPPRDRRDGAGSPLDASRADSARTLAAGLFQAAVQGGATCQVAVAVAATLLRTAYEMTDGSNSKVAPDPDEVDELLRFPEELKALVGAATGTPPASGGQAIQAAVHAGIPTQRANEARGLIRSRAARAHPVPKGKCNEILSKIKHGCAPKPRASSSTSNAEETCTHDQAADSGDLMFAAIQKKSAHRRVLNHGRCCG